MRRSFAESVSGREAFTRSLRTWLQDAAAIQTAEFEIFAIEAVASSPLVVRTRLRYDIVLRRQDRHREERVGSWQIEWVRDKSGAWTARNWEASPETCSSSAADAFIDVTDFALGAIPSGRNQRRHGSDEW